MSADHERPIGELSLLEKVGLYSQYSARVAKHVVSNFASGVRSAFRFNGDLRDALFLEKGIKYTRIGFYSKAIPLLEKVRHDLPDHPDVLLHLGLSYARIGKADQGLELLRRAYETSGSVKTAMILGLMYFEAEDHQNAAGCLERVAEHHPEDYKIRYKLGVCYDNLKQADRAIHWFEEALKLRPDIPKLHRAIGFCYELKGKRAKAIEHFQRATALEEQGPGVDRAK